MSMRKRAFSLYSVSEARNVIFGLATLWIGLFHTGGLTLEPYTHNQFLIEAFDYFRAIGNVGVDMFLFLSGIGLFFSFSKDGRVGQFWKKRLQRVLPTSLFIAAVYFSVRYITGRYTSGVSHFLSRMTFTYFFWKGERVFWFISLILVLYLLFPVLYKIIGRFGGKGAALTVAVLVGLGFALRAFAPSLYAIWEVALCRIPSFVVGIWLGKYVREKREISLHWMWVFLGAAVLMMVVMGNFGAICRLIDPNYTKALEPMYLFIYRYAGSVLGIMLVLLNAFVITAVRRTGRLNWLRNFLEFVGMYSLEYYMIYLNLVHYLERVIDIPANHQIMLSFGCFTVSLALCVIVRKLCDFFMAYMQRKPKKAE